MTGWLSIPWVQTALHGALVGWGSALVVDYAAFRSWKSAHDLMAYDWGVALWRWGQGAVGGAVTSLGLGVVA